MTHTVTRLHDDENDNSIVLAPGEPIPLNDVCLSTHDVCEISGLSFRQLDFGIRCGYYPCEGDGKGSGSRRTFTLPQTRRVILIAWLTKGGLTPAQAAALIDGATTLLLAAFPGGPT